MKTLGIDYGRKKIGLALGVDSFSEPFKVIRVEDFDDAIQKIESEIEVEKPSKVVVGISEGEMAEESKEFAKNLGKEISVPVETFDETLTSQDAQKRSIEAGIKQKRRHEMEDAYAASIILQNYLDSMV